MRVRAVFDNKDGSLIPGQFVKLRMGSAKARPADKGQWVLLDDDIAGLNIPTGIPLVYELDENNVPPGPSRYLDPEAAAAAIEQVANQGKR